MRWAVIFLALFFGGSEADAKAAAFVSGGYEWSWIVLIVPGGYLLTLEPAKHGGVEPSPLTKLTVSEAAKTILHDQYPECEAGTITQGTDGTWWDVDMVCPHGIHAAK